MRDNINYDYFHSDALDLDYCLAKDGSNLWTSDGIKYSMHEIQELKKIGEIDKQSHLVKRIFEGTITECIPRPEPKQVVSADIF